ncbi:NTP transferase domain-containing protein [Chenggangzhangella methanolivorans]|uniref:NTP transferase domain-containing protein n=2 Tax=Chenggangzhangella methanolivorans TaxID=1437009 RepID=A0A9E6R761_9HYPH|nr:NTP transferase domain-containing protein [Chenggangzhangella methanolivorans]QZN99467.1 NTP transferase domain-containing protein [Chenggangzhangella methanolivorans]
MGGRATRMGGGDKALIEVAGRAAIDRLLDRFASQAEPLALSANGDPARFARLRLPVLADRPGDPEGPLAGVLAGLAWAAALPGVTHLATVPGDAPCPPADLVARLAAAAGDGAAVAHGPHGVEPLDALWPVSALGRLEALAREGLRSPKRALEALGAAAVSFDGPLDFLDLDEPADVARAERLLSGR